MGLGEVVKRVRTDRSKTWADVAAAPRPCVRCHIVKSAQGFPPAGQPRHDRRHLARKNPGVARVCWHCIEVEAWMLHLTGWRPRIRVDYIDEHGVEVRVCTFCRESKPHDAAHFAPLKTHGLARTCRPCRAKVSDRARKRQMQREGARIRAEHAKQARDRRKNNPEVKAAEAAARKRWREKIKADPERRAALLETERMARRLAKERQGNGTGKPAKGKTIKTAPRYLPSAPLLALVDRLLDQEKAVNDVLGAPEPNGLGAVRAVCERLGIPPRRVTSWRTGENERVRVGLAERVLLNAEVEWHEVYSYDDYAHIFLALDEVPA
jgi:hypothetical protein